MAIVAVVFAVLRWLKTGVWDSASAVSYGGAGFAAGALFYAVPGIALPFYLVWFGAACAIGFAAWGEHVYLVKCAPHWGQREVIEAYFTHRASPDEPIVAYQMNWKGENFYTGNHVLAMECGLKYCSERTSEWAGAHPHEHVFVVTEHSGCSRWCLRCTPSGAKGTR